MNKDEGPITDAELWYYITFIPKLLWRWLDNICEWIGGIGVYRNIQRNPRARKAMRDDPGVEFMHKGWIIFTVLLVLFILLAGPHHK